MKKTFIIGDVHGCYHTLVALLKKIPSDSRIIFAGDLVDKGKFSKEIIELVIQNNYETILGNHEHAMHKYIQEALLDNDYTSDWARLKGYGGSLTIQSYKENTKLLDKHLAWIETLPSYIEIDNYFITHGFGLPYYKRKDESDSKNPLFSNRLKDEGYSDDWEDNYEQYEVINIFGHCVFKEVEIGKNYYGIDTGCVYGNKLTAIELDSMRIIEQKTLQIDFTDDLKRRRSK